MSPEGISLLYCFHFGLIVSLCRGLGVEMGKEAEYSFPSEAAPLILSLQAQPPSWPFKQDPHHSVLSQFFQIPRAFQMPS